MQTSELLRYLRDPRAVDKTAVDQLKQLVHEYPYFQSAHLLYAMAARNLDDALYQQVLGRTAVSVTSRTHLFRKIKEIETPVTAVTVPEPSFHGSKQALADEQVEHAETITGPKTGDATVPEQSATTPSKGSAGEDEASLSAEETLEKEIGRQVVAAFVEKEILKIPELQVPREQTQAGSFGDWLSFLKKNNGQPYEQITEKVKEDKSRKKQKQQEETENRKKKHLDIIDRIIARNPGPIKGKEEKFYAAESKARESLLESEDLVTETLARIYALQGNTAKAVRSYEILSLKYPQKSAYFASLILKLRDQE
jgi:hypothetical protein